MIKTIYTKGEESINGTLLSKAMRLYGSETKENYDEFHTFIKVRMLYLSQRFTIIR